MSGTGRIAPLMALRAAEAVNEDRRPPTRRPWLLLGLATAIPLAAVAIYFAFLAPPPLTPTAGVPGLPADHPPIGGGKMGQGGDRPHPQMGTTGRSVRIPDVVKGKWRGVRLEVERRDGSSAAQMFTADLGAERGVPGTGLTLRVSEFLPALQVKDNEITSASNDATNPAALVTISEGGKQLFHGWLFSKFPDMQPFEHPTYRIALVEGIPKS